MPLRPNIIGEDLLFDDAPRELPLAQRITEADILKASVYRWKNLMRPQLPRQLRIQGDEIRRVAEAKRKYGKRWKTGGQDHSLQFLEDAGRQVLESPITQGVLTAASFTPLAPIAAPVAAGVAAYHVGTQVHGLATGDRFNLASAAGLAKGVVGFIPGGADFVGHAVEVGQTLERGGHALRQVQRGNYAGAASTAAGVAQQYGAPDIGRHMPRATQAVKRGGHALRQFQRGNYAGALGTATGAARRYSPFAQPAALARRLPKFTPVGPAAGYIGHAQQVGKLLGGLF